MITSKDTFKMTVAQMQAALDANTLSIDARYEIEKEVTRRCAKRAASGKPACKKHSRLLSNLRVIRDWTVVHV